MLTGAIYAGGHISGAHYNPAVTLAFWLRGKFDGKDFPGYLFAQFSASIVASIIGLFLLEDNAPIEASAFSNEEVISAIVSEFLGTFVLVFVILSVATSKTTTGNQYYGLAIGLTVVGISYVFGGVSGGAFNPAVAIGFMVIKMMAWSNIWVFFIACFGSSVFAALIYNYIDPERN